MNRVHRCFLTIISIEVSVDLKTVAKVLMYMYVISFRKRIGKGACPTFFILKILFHHVKLL